MIDGAQLHATEIPMVMPESEGIGFEGCVMTILVSNDEHLECLEVSVLQRLENSTVLQ